MTIPNVILGSDVDPDWGNGVADELNFRGVKGRAQITTDQTGITSIVDITSLTVTWTADPSRIYRTSFFGNYYTSTSGDGMGIYITDSANVRKQMGQFYAGLTTTGQGCSGSLYETGLSGSVTRKLRVLKQFGSGTVTIQANAEFPFQVLVEDIGPA